MKTSKRICNNGSLTIPKAIRADAGMFPGNAVDIESRADGSVLITPVVNNCRFCGSPENVNMVDNIAICNTCVHKILAKVDVTNE